MTSPNLRSLRSQRDELYERQQLRLAHLGWLLLAGVAGGGGVGGALAASMDGDPLFGLAGAVVCPMTCERCEGPLVKGGFRTVEDRRGTGTFFSYSCRQHRGGAVKLVHASSGLGMAVIFGTAALGTILLCTILMLISLAVKKAQWRSFVAEHPELAEYMDLE